MSRELKSNKEIIDWLDELVKEKKEVKLCWEGGNDSGWCWLEVDGSRDETSLEASRLIDMMYDTLDYGSWAWDFSAQGEAMYDPKKKAFIGTAYYVETTGDNKEWNLTVRIPGDIFFDSFFYNIDHHREEDIQVHAEIRIRNGFKTPKVDIIEDQLKQHLMYNAEILVDVLSDDDDYDHTFVSDTIRRTDFKRVEENGVSYFEHVIDKFMYYRSETDEKGIYLSLVEEDLEQPSPENI